MEVRIRVRFFGALKRQAEPPPVAPKHRGFRFLEFVLTSLMLAGTTIGGFETGRAIWTYSTVARAADLGAKYASSRCNADYSKLVATAPPSPETVHREIEDVVKYNTVGLDPKALNIVTTWRPDEESGSTVQVRVSYALPWLFTPLVTAAKDFGIGRDYQIVVTKQGRYSSVG